ncbi:hypothetical protein LFM09_14650 [Lentzea alba]|uniref:hypothetical protein n=1 Tax=Lentzea alba TaxID=2714351 RepID=UPI0039BF8AAF
MSFTVTYRDGRMFDGDIARIGDLLEQLDGPLDDEYPNVSVRDDDTEWVVSAFQTGLLVFENVEEEDGEPRHMENVTRPEMLRVMEMLARGELNEIELLDWRPGYGP